MKPERLSDEYSSFMGEMRLFGTISLDFWVALGLEPIEWSEAVKATGKGAPYIGEILDAAFSDAQAIIVLLTPDDEVRLTPSLQNADEDDLERNLLLQPRANVLFEAGMAFGRSPDRTILVQVGNRPGVLGRC